VILQKRIAHFFQELNIIFIKVFQTLHSFLELKKRRRDLKEYKTGQGRNYKMD
jgi:hypothetical protein